MDYSEARDRFIEAWGNLGSSWGINRSMAQIHALLLISTEPLSTEDIMQELQMSRGNVNMNVRALMDWGIASKVHKAGERREFFTCGKDVWQLAKQVSRERRRREIEPILSVLGEVQKTKGTGPEAEEFRQITSELFDFSLKVDGMIEKFTKSDQSWFFKLLMKL